MSGLLVLYLDAWSVGQGDVYEPKSIGHFIEERKFLEWTGSYSECQKQDELRIILAFTFETGMGFYESLKTKYSDDEAVEKILKVISDKQIKYIQFQDGKWVFDSNLFISQFPKIDASWLFGELVLNPKHGYIWKEVFDSGYSSWAICFSITRHTMQQQLAKKIFLSHKGIDKPLVRQYKAILEELGFSPWIDEDAIVAGRELERELLKGFEESCAAVFFITPDFVDDEYLATEINYALQEKRNKKNRFSIIVLQLQTEGRYGEIPKLLKQYAWKTPDNQASAIIEILRALPMELPAPQWKNIDENV